MRGARRARAGPTKATEKFSDEALTLALCVDAIVPLGFVVVHDEPDGSAANGAVLHVFLVAPASGVRIGVHGLSAVRAGSHGS